VRGDFLVARGGYKPPYATTQVGKLKGDAYPARSKVLRVINPKPLAKYEPNALLTSGIDGSALQSKFATFSLKF
jgi:hypothetical protein